MSLAEKKMMDQIYTQEDRSRTPKEYFKFMVELTKKYGKDKAPLSILDVGCAGGDLMYYLEQCFPGAALVGMDISETLIETAKSKVKAEYLLSNINSPDFEPTGTYDVIYMAGVHLLFDSCEQWVANIQKMLKPDGILIVFGLFNPQPFDVYVKARKSGTDEEYTWNCYSRETLTREFAKHRCKTEFVHWKVPMELPFNAENPLRTWTTPMADGSYMVTNATRIIHDFYCAVVRRN